MTSVPWLVCASWFVFGALLARHWMLRTRRIVETIHVRGVPGSNRVTVTLHQFGHVYELDALGAVMFAAGLLKAVERATEESINEEK